MVDVIAGDGHYNKVQQTSAHLRAIEIRYKQRGCLEDEEIPYQENFFILNGKYIFLAEIIKQHLFLDTDTGCDTIAE